MHTHTHKRCTHKKTKENEPKILNFRKKLYNLSVKAHSHTEASLSSRDPSVLLSENFLQYKAFERQNPANVAGYPAQTEQMCNRSVVQTQQ